MATNGESYETRPQNSEKIVEQNDVKGHDSGEPAPKRVKIEEDKPRNENGSTEVQHRKTGTAPVKKEYLISPPARGDGDDQDVVDDDAAEAKTAPDRKDGKREGKKGKKEKKRGQNTERDFGRSDDAIKLCNSRAFTPEFSPADCRFGDRCNHCHDLRKYLKEGRRDDLMTWEGVCPAFESYGKCSSGWRCRFLSSHMKEIEHEDGRKELILVEEPKFEIPKELENPDDWTPGVVNIVSGDKKFNLSRKRVDLSRSDQYIKWIEQEAESSRKYYHRNRKVDNIPDGVDALQEFRAQFVEPPFKPSEKRRIYFGPETPVLAPLTTQGNLPFRRLCGELGAQVTYSEMAVSLQLIQGHKPEWALLKAHESELVSPRYEPKGGPVPGYDNSRDLKFGAQIAANAPWVAIKATEVLTSYCPHLRLIDLNCGCPIEMVFKQGAGSALLDSPAKMEKIIRGMNAVSGEVPITTKLRLGVRDGKANAQKTIERLAFGNYETRPLIGAPGCAAVTLHGRTRQQRYQKKADWSYIAECATMIKSFSERKDELTDTIREPDESTLANAPGGKMYFIGNGDCFSHTEYFDHINNAKVDSVMIARGACVKPWIFEEIEKGQYLDKSASERLGYIEKFCRYGLEAWGSDEMGLGFTRKFLLEYLSFAYRYVPVGLLEYLPPSLNDRAPAYRGRNDLETLLASPNYKDWIKISEMFLGPAADGFKFQPKHKANSYDIEAEG